jgi:UDP-N-acetyl-D-glucosamine dehydrogenase
MRHYPLPPQESVPLTPSALATCDAAVIVTDHSAVDYRLVVEQAPLVIDTRNATRDLRIGRSNIVLA